MPLAIEVFAMTEQLLGLYPRCNKKVPLFGLYLAKRLQTLGTAKHPFVYANFLSSLDGRIAFEDTAQQTPPFIPAHITKKSDFALFMELHAQADCLITHGGYMRALGEKRLGNILQIKNQKLAAWRRCNNLQSQPAIIIASASLEFPMHSSLRTHKQTVLIATGQNANINRIQYWKKRGYPVLICGEDRMVQGKALIRLLKERGYRSIYLIAGPRMLDTMIRDRQLCRLYLTITHQLIGGLDFRTLLTGPPLFDEGDMTLKSLYYQAKCPIGSGQFFMEFDLSIRNDN